MPYLNTIITVSATLLSGLLTLIVTRIFDERREKRVLQVSAFSISSFPKGRSFTTA